MSVEPLVAILEPLAHFNLKLFYVLLLLMLLDVASGLLKAYQQGRLSSSVMREGLVRKGQMLVLLCAIAILEGHAWNTSTGASAFTVLCCLAELRSIAENAAQSGFDVRDWLSARFGKGKGDDDGNP